MWEFWLGWLVWERVIEHWVQSVSSQVSDEYKWTSLTLKYSFLLILLHMYKQFICLEKTASFYFESHISQQCPQRHRCPFFFYISYAIEHFDWKKEKTIRGEPQSLVRVHHIQSQHAAHLRNNWHKMVKCLIESWFSPCRCWWAWFDAYLPACGSSTVLYFDKIYIFGYIMFSVFAKEIKWH